MEQKLKTLSLIQITLDNIKEWWVIDFPITNNNSNNKIQKKLVKMIFR